MIRTAPTESSVRLTARGPVQHLCPFVDEVDLGKIAITWETDGWTIELHSLAEYLQTFHRREISHEDLVAEVRAELAGLHGVRGVSVSADWSTAGMGVTCSTLETLAKVMR